MCFYSLEVCSLYKLQEGTHQEILYEYGMIISSSFTCITVMAIKSIKNKEKNRRSKTIADEFY